MSIDGFPIAIYAQPIATLRRWSDLGCNTHVSPKPKPDHAPPSMEAYCKAAAGVGMKTIIGPGDNPAATAALPGVVGFLAEDEPDLMTHLPKGPDGKPSPDLGVKELETWAAGVRAKAPGVPIVTIFAGPDLAGVKQQATAGNPRTFDHYRRFMAVPDWPCFDLYPANTAKPYHDLNNGFGKAMDRALDFGGGKPVIAWGECCDQHVHDAGRSPTPKEIWAWTALAIIRGARGIGYFPYELPGKRGGQFKFDAVTDLNAATIQDINTMIRGAAEFLVKGKRKSISAGDTESAEWSMPDGSKFRLTLEYPALKVTPAFTPPNVSDDRKRLEAWEAWYRRGQELVRP